jgi:hypothetical protein
LRHVYRAGKYSGVRGPREHAVAGQATPERGDPAIDSRNLNPRDNFNRDKRQPVPDEEALEHCAESNRRKRSADNGVAAYRADERNEKCVRSVAHLV